MILINRVKVTNLVISTRSIKKTRFVIYYYYKKLDYLKLNYLNKDKKQIETKKRVIKERMERVWD